jgi:3-methyladenine DNA glycosylase AlkD
LGSVERAEGEKRYLKSDLEFIGASWPQISAVIGTFREDLAALDRAQVLELAEALWARPIHERRAVAAAILGARARLLTPGDMPFLERLIRESRTWALVDELAEHPLGNLLSRHPGEVASVLRRWSTDPDFWVRRASLLAWLRPLRDGASPERFLACADAMLDEREFFIRKAIGWILRELGKRRPDVVLAWLAPRTARASGVTMREAVKYLPPAEGERLMAAYRERRAAD